MAGREQSRETMSVICLQSPENVDLLHAVLCVGERRLEFCGLLKEVIRDGRLWQWWIVMDA